MLDCRRQQAKSTKVHAERIEAPDRSRRGRPVGAQTESEPDVRQAVLAREEPSVTGEAAPGPVVPQSDDRPLDVLGYVAAMGEPPQDRGVVDQPGGSRDATRGSIGADHDVGGETAAVCQLDHPFAHGGATCDGFRSCVDCSLA